jgi:uncharacterized protein
MEDAKLRPLPIILVVFLGLAIPYLAAVAAVVCSRYLHSPSPQGPTLPFLYVHHAFQLAFALIAIAIVKRWHPFDAGLRWPPGKTYLVPAALWGAFFGVLMTLVDHGPDLFALRAPHLDFSLDAPNVAGWLFFEGVYVGPTEEIPFRSLLVGYLLSATPARVRVGRFEMGWAGVIVAAIFALAHAGNLMKYPSWAGFGQQIYAFALGVLYAYWFEKSRSIVAPILGHNASDFVEYAIVLAFAAAWS